MARLTSLADEILWPLMEMITSCSLSPPLQEEKRGYLPFDMFGKARAGPACCSPQGSGLTSSFWTWPQLPHDNRDSPLSSRWSAKYTKPLLKIRLCTSRSAKKTSEICGKEEVWGFFSVACVCFYRSCSRGHLGLKWNLLTGIKSREKEVILDTLLITDANVHTSSTPAGLPALSICRLNRYDGGERNPTKTSIRARNGPDVRSGGPEQQQA